MIKSPKNVGGFLAHGRSMFIHVLLVKSIKSVNSVKIVKIVKIVKSVTLWYFKIAIENGP